MLVAVLSDKPELREQFCKMVGKETGRDELAFYSAEGGKTFVDPAHYPEKIQPLLYTLSLADCAVLIVDALSPKVGELIVALNSVGIERGVLVSSIPLPVAGTVLDKYEKAADMNAAREKVLALQETGGGERAVALVHKAEAVKSVGNVAHGVVKSGKMAKERVFVLPEKKEIEIRDLKVNEQDVAEASAGTSFSATFRGDLFERGLLVPMRNEFQIENVVNGKFNKSPFFKDELKGRIHAYTNMQFVEGHLTDNDLTLLKPLAFEKGEQIVIVDASNQKLRIAGVFQSKW